MFKQLDIKPSQWQNGSKIVPMLSFEFIALPIILELDFLSLWHFSVGFCYCDVISQFVILAIGMIYMKWDVMSEFLNRDTISWVLISACLAFISGQVWNSIRGPQYLMRARGLNCSHTPTLNKFIFNRWRYWLCISIISTSADCRDPYCSYPLWNDDWWSDYTFKGDSTKWWTWKGEESNAHWCRPTGHRIRTHAKYI